MVHRYYAVTRLCILFYLHMYCIMAIYITYAPMKNKNSLYLSILLPVVYAYNHDSFEHFNRFPCVRGKRQNIYMPLLHSNFLHRKIYSAKIF